MKFDYKLLEALTTIIQYQSFDKAASKLCITQSAISQRIKLLEENIGQPVIVRCHPIIATEAGERLVVHFKMVRALEDTLLPELNPDSPKKPIKISLAVNADSIATWFLGAITPILKNNLVELDFIVKNEYHSIEALRSGQATGAVSCIAKALPGYQSFKLGDMTFILVCSPEFAKRYFPDGINNESLRSAPGMSFDTNDDMLIKFIEQHFDIQSDDYYCHRVHSSQAFVELAKRGAAYCLAPTLQIEQELASGELINLAPDKSIIMTLYWHSWVLVQGIHKKISKEIVRYAQSVLG